MQRELRAKADAPGVLNLVNRYHFLDFCNILFLSKFPNWEKVFLTKPLPGQSWPDSC